MLDPEIFWLKFEALGVNFATGVPDSLLKDFCYFLEDNLPKKRHIIAANEGGSIAIATGHYISSEKPALVYMQNSGIGNAINPLLSLADEKVYSIPMILIVGWRGEPGVKDEPQHAKQGQIMIDLLKALRIKYRIVSPQDDNEDEIAKTAYENAMINKSPYVLLIKKGTFKGNSSSPKDLSNNFLNRESVIEIITNYLPRNSVVVSTTGHISRELYEIRKKNKCHENIDFLTVGSMGHSSQIALSIAINKPNLNIFCIDGDGSFLMHMGSAAINGNLGLNNFNHIVLNNGSHGSVGGQPTVGFNTNLINIAKSCNYKNLYGPIDNFETLKFNLRESLLASGPKFMEVYVDNLSRKDLGRPKESPLENKLDIMQKIKNL